MIVVPVKFIYSEKATKFYKISTVDLTVTTWDKSTVEILQKFVAFSEYMNFNWVEAELSQYTIDESIQGAASLRRYGITFDDNIHIIVQDSTSFVTYVFFIVIFC